MFEIRDGERLIAFDSNLHDVLLQSVDYLTSDSSYLDADLTDEELLEVIEQFAVSRVKLIVSARLDANLSVVQHILE